jgi:hypothetical protein
MKLSNPWHYENQVQYKNSLYDDTQNIYSQHDESQQNDTRHYDNQAQYKNSQNDETKHNDPQHDET